MTGSARNLPVAQGLWIGGELSVLERLSIASFLKNGHRVHLYTYEGVTSAPEGTEVRDGRRNAKKYTRLRRSRPAHELLQLCKGAQTCI